MRRREALRLGAAGLVGAAGAYGIVSATSRQAGDDAAPYGPLGSVELQGTTEVVTDDAGTLACVATTTGYATVGLSDPADPTVLADVRDLLADREGGPLGDVYDVSIDGDRLLVVGPAHDHSAALNAALLIDVSDPAEPTRLSVFETDYHIHNAVLDGDYAYLCGNEMVRNPLVVLDLSEPSVPREAARWSILDADPAWEPVDPILRYLHDVWVRDGLAALAYWDAGTWLVDISEPTDPTPLYRLGPHEPDDLAGLSAEAVDAEQQTLPGNAHSAATDPTNSILAVGLEAWALDAGGDGGPGGIELYDITDPTAPQQVASIGPPDSPDPSRDGVWTSAHNFELSTDRLYSSWYKGGLMIHDITDPADPTRIAAWRDPEAVSFWTAQQGVPGETVVAGSMGLRGDTPGVWLFPDRAGRQEERPSLD